MDVVNENFYQLLPEIECAIDECSFIAIDGEFTGLHNGTMVSVFDTAAQYYQKLRSNCMDFLMVQFGLCAVKYNDDTKKFTYRAYNFYTFPKPMSRYAPDCRFLCQSSSMEFLSNNNFDFNKLFKHGIPFLTAPDEKVLRDELFNRYKQSCLQAQTPSKVSDAIPIPENHKVEVERACERVRELLENDTISEVIIAEKSNSFVRKLIYQEVNQMFPDSKVSIQSKIVEDIGNVMIAYKGRSKELMAKERMEREQIELEKAVGFSAVLKKIRNSNKPVIGHNMTLDVCHMIHQFCLPLPSSYNEFQDVVKIISPRFLDTKYISGTEPLKEFFGSTVLNDLNKTLAEMCQDYTILEPEVPEVGYSRDSSKLHDAGFDAYLTSSVFVNLCNLYSRVKKIKEQVFVDSVHLKPYENKLYMIRYNEDPCLNLNGPEPQLQRNHVYHITFPPEWKTIDITNIFSPFTNVFIKYINDTSAWVALRDGSQAKAMNKILPKLQAIHKNIVLLPWSVYYNDKNTSTLATKRKIGECSSSPPKDNVDSSKDECSVGQSPEKVPRISKGRRVSKGGNISPILEGDESVELGIKSKFKFQLQSKCIHTSIPSKKVTPQEVTSILSSKEHIYEFEPSFGSVKAYETNQLESNIPIEDTRAEGKCLLTSGMLFGVFDGHGGPSCSHVITKRLFDYICVSLLPKPLLIEYLESGSKLVEMRNETFDLVAELKALYAQSLKSYVLKLINERQEHQFKMKDALEKAFLQLDEDIMTEATLNISNEVNNLTLNVALSGSVASVAHIDGPHLHVASAGDCLAVVGMYTDDDTWIAKVMVEEHNTDNLHELNRVISEHPSNEKDTVIKYERLLGQLAPLRAFGDLRYKWSREMLIEHIVPKLGENAIPPFYYTPPYLTAKPQIAHHHLQPRDRFLVLATDGLWDFMTPLQVVRLVGEHMSGKVTLTPLKLPKENMKLSEINQLLLQRRDSLKRKPVDANACTHLLRNALGGSEYGVEHAKLSQLLNLPKEISRSYRDDITITIVYFNTEYLRHPQP